MSLIRSGKAQIKKEQARMNVGGPASVAASSAGGVMTVVAGTKLGTGMRGLTIAAESSVGAVLAAWAGEGGVAGVWSQQHECCVVMLACVGSA